MLRYLPSLLLLGLIGAPGPVSAHQLDEYLQATLVDIGPRAIRLRMQLTPGVEVADQVLELVDPDGNGVLTEAEVASYAAMLKQDLDAQLDGSDVELELVRARSAAVSELHTGWGAIELEFGFPLNGLSAGTHQMRLENRHLPSISTYLCNATRPQSGAVQIAGQQRSSNQSSGEFEFVYQPLGAARRWTLFLAIAFCVTIVYGYFSRRIFHRSA